MGFLQDIIFSPSRSPNYYSSSGSSSPTSPSAGDKVNEHHEGKSPLPNSAIEQDTQNMPELPPLFSPDDQELISYFLVKKVLGRTLRFNILIETNPFEYDPDQLPLGMSNSIRVRVPENEGYCFTITEPNGPTKLKASDTTRFTPNGCWSQHGGDVSIFQQGELIGFRKNWVFYWREPTNAPLWQFYYWKIAPNGQTEYWLMHEYRLNPSLFPHETFDDFVLSKIGRCILCRIQHLYR